MKTIYVQKDVQNMDDAVTDVLNSFKNFDKLIVELGESISKALLPITDSLHNVESGIYAITDALTITNSMLADFRATLEDSEVQTPLHETIYSVVTDFISLISTAKKAKELFGPVVSFIKEYSSAIKAFAPEVGTLTAIFPNLSVAVSGAGQKMREFGGAIGTAFSNFGSTIAQLASSTGAWIANTAAKVGNTAAQWAQVAATTAWQAICTAATAVTTAFGAAMNFLASPIGLVVIAIVALIAIIVLLIANWDTVKAAVLTAWEAITGALATAADWFNANVIQPIVGFFTTAIDWISTKLQEGMAFVQGIFAGISEFLQGMFAKDWTEQFGAFGNVLNAFFANVENVWNAVKDIFNGIVGFVKNVFAGDCLFSEILLTNRISES